MCQEVVAPFQGAITISYPPGGNRSAQPPANRCDPSRVKYSCSSEVILNDHLPPLRTTTATISQNSPKLPRTSLDGLPDSPYCSYRSMIVTFLIWFPCSRQPLLDSVNLIQPLVRVAPGTDRTSSARGS